MVAKLAGNSLTNRLMFCVLFLLWMVFGTLAYWAWYPISPAIVVVAERVTPWEAEVIAGHTITRELTFHITRQVELAVNSRLVEQNCVKCRIFELEQSVKSYAPGEYTQSRSVTVPAMVPRGTYRFEAAASWQATPLRRGYTVLPSHILKVIDTAPAKPGISMSKSRFA